MSYLGSIALHYGLFFYHFIMDYAVLLSLCLTLSGYDIKVNLRKIAIASLFLGTSGVIAYHIPQSLRVIFMAILIFATIKFYFGFTPSKSLIIFLVFASFSLISASIIALILHYGLGISAKLTSPLIHFLYPLFYNIPLTIITYVGYRRNWRIFKKTSQEKIPVKMILPPIAQFLFLAISANEFFFASHFDQSTRFKEVTIFSFLIISTLLSIFFTWRILRVAEREAAAAAQENLAEEMRRQIDAARAQRHDFINHVQIMTALLKDGQKEELARYAGALKREL